VAQDDLRLGTAIRLWRERGRRRQIDIATDAGVSRQCVSLMERGHLDALSVRTARAIAAAAGIDLPFAPRGRGAQFDRLVDEEHSAIVDSVISRLVADGWDPMVEFSFNDYGDRGSVDILAWHAEWDALLVVEVKSRLANLQDTCRSLDVKARIVPRLAAQARAWRPRVIGVVLVVPESTREREAVARRRSTFAASFPARTVEIRRWLRRPAVGLRGLWFLRFANTSCAKRESSIRIRARQPPGVVDWGRHASAGGRQDIGTGVAAPIQPRSSQRANTIGKP
jgi:transcriptional regulator with XRE-family HTH domain